MYSYNKLPASLNQRESLDGILDFFGMRSYWNALKTKIKDLQGLGTTIMLHFQRISLAQQKLVARGDTRGAAVLDDELKKIADDMQKWSKVKQYMDTYMPEWMKLDEGEGTAPGGVSAVPFLLAGMALTALAYCVNVGLALLQDYSFKMNLTQAVIDQKLTTGQYQDIISVPKEEGVFEKVIGNVGVGAAFAIPSVLLVGGGLYLLVTTGMLQTMLKSIGIKGSA